MKRCIYRYMISKHDQTRKKNQPDDRGQDQIDIQPDGELIFGCPPYEDNDLTLNSLKEDMEICGNLPDVDDDGFDVYFTCYNCEGEADSAVIEIDGQKYTDAKEALLKIIENIKL